MTKIKNDFYWEGILDSNLRVFDIVMSTPFGTTYNSYILKTNSGLVLFETVKDIYCGQWLENLQKNILIKDIKYLVVSHTEPDHSGSIEKLLELNPHITIICSATASNFLDEIINNKGFNRHTIVDGEEFNIGNKTLRFYLTPNLHWPDTMFTYVVEDKILVTCDCFGCHYSTEQTMLSGIQDRKDYLISRKNYFEDILSPFKPFVIQTLDKIKDLEINCIATGHGPIIDNNIEELFSSYYSWCRTENRLNKAVLIAYVSAYGYTKTLAKEIENVLKQNNIVVWSYDLVSSNINEVVGKLKEVDAVLFGTPTILSDALKPIYDLINYLNPIVHKNLKVSSFGSYGWSGEATGNIVSKIEKIGLKTMTPFKIRFKPNEDKLFQLYDYVENFIRFLNL